MVSENTAVVEGAALSRTDRGHYSEWQQLELSVDGEMSGISNPYSDILVRVDQNGREETARWLRNPTRVEGVKMTYEHQPDLIFPASNEYRRFESVSNGFPGMHVDSLRYMGSNYHVAPRKMSRGCTGNMNTTAPSMAGFSLENTTPRIQTSAPTIYRPFLPRDRQGSRCGSICGRRIHPRPIHGIQPDDIRSCGRGLPCRDSPQAGSIQLSVCGTRYKEPAAPLPLRSKETNTRPTTNTAWRSITVRPDPRRPSDRLPYPRKPIDSPED